MADNAILSPSFVNMNNNISNIDNVQKTNTNNEDELLNGENSIIKINNLLKDLIINELFGLKIYIYILG